MDTILQTVVAVGGLSGWGAIVFGVAWHVSGLRRELKQAREAQGRRRRSLQAARSRFETLERRYRRQLEQTRILFEIEQVLADRLAEAEGGAASTKKREARTAAEDRLGGDTRFNRRVTSPTGVADELQRLDMVGEEATRIFDDEEADAAADAATAGLPSLSLAA